jgi:hypothetical protein
MLRSCLPLVARENPEDINCSPMLVLVSFGCVEVSRATILWLAVVGELPGDPL